MIVGTSLHHGFGQPAVGPVDQQFGAAGGESEGRRRCRPATPSQNGFRYVIHNGLAGWIADQYLTWSPAGNPTGETFTATANLNLRAEPNSGAQVKLLIPSGATVKALAGVADGWREVSYNGVSGWAATAYLN